MGRHPEYKKCSIEGCGKRHEGYGFCKNHKYRFMRHSNPLAKARQDDNEINCSGDICEISLYNTDNQVQAKTLIDKDDVEKVRGIRWELNQDGYVVGRGKSIRLHNVVLPHETKKGFCIDHINRIRTDNRKANLRYVSYRENIRNRNLLSTNKTGGHGVRFCKRNNKWQALLIITSTVNSREEAIVERKKLEEKFYKVEI